METQENNKKNNILMLIAIFIVGGIAGFVLTYLAHENSGTETAHPVRQSGYKLINPLLECEVENISEGKNLAELEKKIELLIENETKKDSVSVMAVYFRDLNNGPWFGINDSEKFTPASLLKVPLAIAYFKKAEIDPTLMEREIEYSTPQIASPVEMQNFKPKEKLETGKKYKIKDLIERMIVYSDNNAANLLFEEIDHSTLDKTYPDLGMPVPNDLEPENYMSVISYASFFRTLFNASYLDRIQSEQLLEVLSHSEFKEGLVAGVPSSITVAHKFGERKIEYGSSIKNQLHDCGIVYYPDHPYLLCVMSKGDNFVELKETIRKVSKEVYEELDKKYQSK